MTDVTNVEADPKRPIKAYAATALAFLSLFVAYWIADEDPFTLKEAGAGLLTAALGSGLTGGVTFSVKNPLKRKV